ncbi:LIM and senescent cell antigen-like-containing domain protein 2 isoform X2 [Artibeus jamaicensis]|uniref:LIM and senescent cell antigen-like-containing domain protein 2 isoform X2 n=1 Tax=Artibeus jamaicensis TaxID=9417 RepID=UPI00235AE114|nr:LIM and senescent cell antigen-like-containing domain protein 2 isoform X2 [Artibeus jamaicensis]
MSVSNFLKVKTCRTGNASYNKLLADLLRVWFEGPKYCEHDFQMLFAPCCGSCGKFIISYVIKAMNSNWHLGCFCCELCDVELADLGFVKNAGRKELTAEA